MDLRQLECFVVIARTGSFTAAAAECHLSQSAMSHQVARLESQLGVRLFDRSGRGVSLTEAGRTIHPYALRVLGDVDDMAGALATLAGQVRGRVRVGLTQTAERLFALAVRVAEFRRSNPSVSVTVSIGPAVELVDQVAADELDLAYAAAPERPLPDGLLFEALIPSEPLVAVVAVGHPRSGLESAYLGDLLADEELIEFAPPSALRARTTQMLTSAGVRSGRDGLSLGSVAEMVRFAAAGMGIAIVPNVFTRGDLPGSGLSPFHVIRLLDPEANLAFGVYRRMDRLTAAAAALLQQTMPTDQ